MKSTYDNEEYKHIHEAARVFLENDFSVFPTRKDKTPAVPSWTVFKKRPINPDKVADYFNGHERMAIITGSASGNLEMIDVDDRHLFSEIRKKISKFEFADKILFEQSPNGYHVVYRCEDKIEGNMKLSMGWEEVDEAGEYEWNNRTTLKAVEIDGKWIVSPCLIETRGEGGYFLCAPSKGYSIIEGAWGSLDPLTKEERAKLLALGRSFDKRPEAEALEEQYDEDLRLKIKRPGDLYNELWESTIPSLLEEYGWTKTAATPKSTLWRRPGKSKGNSGELHNDGQFQCYSTSVAELETEGKQYKAFTLLTALKFGGDFAMAAAHVAGDYEVIMSEEEVKEVLEDNPEEIDNAYNYSGLDENIITQLLLDLSIPVPPGKKQGRVTVKYRHTQLNTCTKEVDQALCKVPGDWGYFHLLGSVGYVQDNQFHMYNKDSLELRIEQSVEIKTKTKKQWYTDRCPMHIVNKLLSYPGTDASKIKGFSSTPMVARDGTIYGLEHGYENGIYFTHNGGFKISDLSWRDCYDKLVDILCKDILFDPKHHEVMQAAYIGFMLAMICRPGFSGGCPAYLFNANESGTGKSTAIHIALRLVTGDHIGSTTWMDTQDERAKSLIAQLTAGGTVLLYDNIQKGTEIDDGNFAEAITAGKITGRRLGKSEVMKMDCRMGIVFGGNGLTVSQELARRLVFINLVTPTVNPQNRKFQNENIMTTVIKNRIELLSYLLRMLQLGANMENKIKGKLSGVGTFWDAMVRNPIMGETGVDILNALGTGQEGSSNEVELKDQVIELLRDLYAAEGEKSFTARHLYNWVNSEGEETGALITDVKDSLIELNGFAFKSTKSLGRALMLIANRPSSSGYIIKPERKGQRAVMYHIVESEEF